ncbi:MAG: DPP IV N-terminal domain-containing protein [Acidobacteriaceae bacterium]
MRRSLLLVGLLLAALSSVAQAAPQGEGKAWTNADLWQTGGPTGRPPRDYLWSPDSASVTYLSQDFEHGQPDDVITVNAANGAASVLVPETKLAAIYGAKNDERDRDHRARYGVSSYHWSPDSKRLIFDNTGTLWVYDLRKGTAVEEANTGAGSGDDPKFSPDGRSISFVRDHNLHVLTLDSRHDAALTNTMQPTLLNGEVDWVYEEELDVRSNYFWSPDSKHIAYLQMDEAAVPTYPITDWLPTQSTVDGQRYPQPGDANPGVRVGIVAANGGDTLWLHVPVNQHDDYIPRFGWLDSHHVWIEVLRRDHRHIELFFANTETGAVRSVLQETAHKFFDEAYDVWFLKDGQFLWSSWRDGHTHLYLYRYDAANPMASGAALVRQLTHGDWEVLSVAGIDEKQGTVYYTSNETDVREEMLWQVGLDGGGRKLLTTFHGVHHITFSPDATHYVDSASSLMQPPTVSVCGVAGTCTPFWKSRPLDGYKLVAPVMFTGKAVDGTTLYGELLLPPDLHAKDSVPLIVNPYGGPHVQIVRDEFGGQAFLFDQLLMQHGFAVLHVDNRGMGNRSRTFQEAAYRDFGPVQLQDQLTMVDQVLRQYPQLDAKRMGWWGWSWGGTFTLYAMTHSDRFVAGVCVAPVTNWRLYDSIYTERYLGLPEQNQQTYEEDSVVNSAAQLHGNLLMVQGTGDDNVHMQNTIQMIQRFVTAGVPYRLMLYPRKTHSISGPAAQIHLFDAILQQFETNLRPSTASR